MPSHISPELELVEDTTWSALHIEQARIDPGIRLVASLIDVGDAEQLFRRTGMRVDESGHIENPQLPVLIELRPADRMGTLTRLSGMSSSTFSLTIDRVFGEEAARNPHMRVISARLGWGSGPVVMSADGSHGLRRAFARLLADPGVARAALPAALQPSLEDSFEDLDMPPNRMVSGRRVSGQGVIVGVIDDGCALAHPHFLAPGTLQSRILFLWDQGGATPVPGGPWTNPVIVTGRALTQASINAVLAACTVGGRIDEERVYATLGYQPEETAHGTRVLDIAAGNGSSLMGHEGVASEADIIFVQLPQNLVEQGGAALETNILAGVQYIFQRAAALNRQAVVNISFGGYCGPHDGTSLLSTGIDGLLQQQSGRAVVVSAGNGFEADCHAQQSLAPNADATPPLAWLVQPENPTSSQMEIWYEGTAQLQMRLQPPGAMGPLPPVGLNQWRIIRRVADGRVMGWIQHVPSGGSNVIRINLNASEGGFTPAGPGPAPVQQVIQNPVAPFPAAAPPPPPLTAPAHAGAWIVRLRNSGNTPANFHAWIERDDMRRLGRRRGQRSRFEDMNTNPFSTVADVGTGQHVICVGAHNTATGELCRYSACGPTRNPVPRVKPDFTAPAEETAIGGGVLCASARRGRPSRMRGTSAAAPHVTGLVALIMQVNARPTPLARILTRLNQGAAAGLGRPLPPWRLLRHNAHQAVDPHRPPAKRHSANFPGAIGAGKVNAIESTR